MSPFRTVDHTADIMLEVEAAELRELFLEAARGLYAVIGSLATAGDDARETLVVHGRSDAERMQAWLSEALFLFETRMSIIEAIDDWVPDDERLSLAVRLRRVDAERSQFSREVKAVTYHELRVERAGECWSATVILDI